MPGVGVAEIYLPARVNKLAAKIGLAQGHLLDLKHGWDLSKADEMIKAWKLLKPTDPYVGIGSPPCTLLSMLQKLNLYIHGNNI